MDIYIVGCGGLAKELTQIVNDYNDVNDNTMNIVAYISNYHNKSTFLNKKLITEDSFLKNCSGNEKIIIALGNIKYRKNIINKFKSKKFDYPNLVHPTARVPNNIRLGNGNVVSAFNYFTYDGIIGDFNYISPHNIFGHDISIGNLCQINSSCSISGKVKIGDEVFIAPGSIIKNGIEIGNKAMVTMGAVVIESVEDGKIVGGFYAIPNSAWVRKMRDVKKQYVDEIIKKG